MGKSKNYFYCWRKLNNITIAGEKVNISTIARKSKLHFYYEGKLTTAAGGKVNISIASEQCKHSTIAGESKHYYNCWEK